MPPPPLYPNAPTPPRDVVALFLLILRKWRSWKLSTFVFSSCLSYLVNILQYWYPNYPNLDIYSGCYIQCQYSDRSICNIGTQITQIQNIYPYSGYNIQNTYPYLEASRPTLWGGLGGGCPPRNSKFPIRYLVRSGTWHDLVPGKTWQIRYLARSDLVPGTQIWYLARSDNYLID